MKFAEHVRLRKEKFGAVVFDTLNEKVFVADEIGLRILSLLEEGKSSQEISRALAEVYDADSQVIAADVASFVQDLKGKRLIV